MNGTGPVLLLFLDGVGIGENDAEVNPFVRAGGSIPTLWRLMGDGLPTLDRPHRSGPSGVAFPLDALLDVDGTPQSGTGQVALLTGASAAELHGHHFGPWTPFRLRPLVEESSVLKRAVDAGLSAAFANAYPKNWPGKRGSRRIAGPPLAARGAGLLNRHEEELGDGRAVSSEIVNDGWRRHLGHDWLPQIDPETAGRNLAGIANSNDLTLYAHYTTDAVGHDGSMDDAVLAIQRVDRFLAGVIEVLDASVTLLVASDHGNIEDVRAGHTRNPVLGVASGPGAARAAELTDLRDVTDGILRILGVG